MHSGAPEIGRGPRGLDVGATQPVVAVAVPDLAGRNVHFPRAAARDLERGLESLLRCVARAQQAGDDVQAVLLGQRHEPQAPRSQAAAGVRPLDHHRADRRPTVARLRPGRQGGRGVAERLDDRTHAMANRRTVPPRRLTVEVEQPDDSGPMLDQQPERVGRRRTAVSQQFGKGVHQRWNLA